MSIYQIKVTLKYSRPPIWRRIQVASDITLGELHPILQIVMGWDDAHLHAFRSGPFSYGIPDPDYFEEMEDEGLARLDQVVDVGGALVYEYDFGDSWEHNLKIEKALPATPGVHYPTCLTGKRACPPEDCGGIPGYENLLEIINDPTHEEHEELLDWAGPFDAEAFDGDEVNRVLGKVQGGCL